MGRRRPGARPLLARSRPGAARGVIQRLPNPVALEGGAFYDDREVFTTYMQHPAWAANPNDTIEEPAFLELLGDVRGRRVLDLGCGDGRLGRQLLDNGALSYLGVDASINMVEFAERTPPGCVGTIESKHSPRFRGARMSLSHGSRCTT